MNRKLILAAVLAAAACSQKPAQNYRRCLKLRVGMTREELLKEMGPADETLPYVEGKSLPHLKGRTAYEWSTPASMPAPNRVTVDDASGKVESIRCGDASVTAAVFVEPPAPAVSTAPFVLPSDPPAAPPPSRRGPKERTNGIGSSGRPLTE